MSSEVTSSPVSASTFRYLIRWPVLRLIWLNETFSVSEVAGYRATGQVTSERRKKPFQLARGAMGKLRGTQQTTVKNTIGGPGFKHGGPRNLPTALTESGRYVPARACDLLDRQLCAGSPKTRNMICHQTLLLTGGVEAIAGHYRHLWLTF